MRELVDLIILGLVCLLLTGLLAYIMTRQVAQKG